MLYEIKTERLLLRPLDIADLETVHIYASDNENTMYMMWLPNKTKEETLRFLTRVTNEWKKEKPDFYEFAIIYNDIQIGAVSLYLDQTRTIGELGWIINKDYWRQGFSTEAALAIKDFAIETLKISKLIAHCDYRNEASYKLMKKIGLSLENDAGLRTNPRTSETVRELKYSLIIY